MEEGEDHMAVQIGVSRERTGEKWPKNVRTFELRALDRGWDVCQQRSPSESYVEKTE